MDIIQLDSQTIRIKKSGFTFQLYYHYSWDRILRTPESVVLDGNKVNVFFPTSVLRDAIIEQDRGFTIKRFWDIIPAGEICLFFTLDLLDHYTVPYLFPCLLYGNKVPREKIIIMGERLSYPSSVFLFPGNKCIMISASYPRKPEDQGSISVGIAPVDSGSRLRTEIIFPPTEKLPRELLTSAGYLEGPEDNYFTSQGNLKKELEFHVLIESEKEIYASAVTKVHKRLGTILKKQLSFTKGEALDIVKKGIEKIISSLIVNNQGIAGPRVSEGSNIISATATAGFSCLVQRFFETDLSMHEASLEYADFVLKSQHPRGIFFENYFLSQKEWVPDESQMKKTKGRDKTIKPPVASILYSSQVAYYLLTLSEILKQKGYYSEKYFMAALKCVNLFFDQKNRLIDFGSDLNLDTLAPEKLSLHCLEFIQPLIILLRQTEKEKYKKAIKKIKDDFLFDSFPDHSPPALDNGERPDVATSLILLKSVITLMDAGFVVKNVDLFIQMILPWIYFNKSSSPAPFEEVISMMDSFSRNRLVFHGFECAYYFLKFAPLTEVKKHQKLLNDLARDIIMATRNIPIGTPWLQHALWDHEANVKTQRGLTGEFSSRAFVREAWYLLNIVEEFPGMLL